MNAIWIQQKEANSMQQLGIRFLSIRNNNYFFIYSSGEDKILTLFSYYNFYQKQTSILQKNQRTA